MGKVVLVKTYYHKCKTDSMLFENKFDAFLLMFSDWKDYVSQAGIDKEDDFTFSSINKCSFCYGSTQIDWTLVNTDADDIDSKIADISVINSITDAIHIRVRIKGIDEAFTIATIYSTNRQVKFYSTQSPYKDSNKVLNVIHQTLLHLDDFNSVKVAESGDYTSAYIDYLKNGWSNPSSVPSLDDFKKLMLDGKVKYTETKDGIYYMK